MLQGHWGVASGDTPKRKRGGQDWREKKADTQPAWKKASDNAVESSGAEMPLRVVAY